MDKKDLLRMAQDPRYIPGIYNYCDRWCERCAFTSRCLTYATDCKDDSDPAVRDVRNKAFWDRLQAVLEQTEDMLDEMELEGGTDLDLSHAESAQDGFFHSLEESRHHELALSARRYSEMVDRWVRSAGIKPESGPGGPSCETSEFSDAMDIILWYQHQIYVKLGRALAHNNFPDGPEEDSQLQTDSDGSALIALIAIDRSIGACGYLYKHLPGEGDSLLDMLIHLRKLRNDTERSFPRARNFKRPGFDELN